MPLALAPAIPVAVAFFESGLAIQAARGVVRAVDLEIHVACAERARGLEERGHDRARMALSAFALLRDDVEEAGAVVLDDGESRRHDPPGALYRDRAQRERHALESRQVRAAMFGRRSANASHRFHPR